MSRKTATIAAIAGLAFATTMLPSGQSAAALAQADATVSSARATLKAAELKARRDAQLVKIDAKWVPEGEGSLYLRPFMFASEAFLGVRPSREYIFCVIASPVGNYFKSGAPAVSLYVEGPSPPVAVSVCI